MTCGFEAGTAGTLQGLELTDNFATISAVHGTMQIRVNVVTEEPHGSVGHQDLCTARVPASRSKEAGKMDDHIGNPAVWRVIAVRHRADCSRVRP